LHILLTPPTVSAMDTRLLKRSRNDRRADPHGAGTLRINPADACASLIEETSPRRRRADDDERRRYYRITALGQRSLELELQRLSRVVSLARTKHLLRDPGVA
jgi:DNA-binding MarR family transcriptional regulator